jgi:YbbR domain-containing protein
VILNPAYVTITGPKADLAKIQSWKTDTLSVKNVGGVINTRIQFKRPSLANINIYPSYTEVKVPVEEFTEKTIEIPITVLNNKNYRDINFLPEKVKITFMTAIGNYSRIDRDYFEASVDLDNWTLKSYKQLPVMLTRFPDFCKLVRVEPQVVDFIIQK